MAEFHIAPRGEDAIEYGTIIDDNGQRFVAIVFSDESGDSAVITMLIPTLLDLAEKLGEMATLVQTRDYWRNHPRG